MKVLSAVLLLVGVLVCYTYGQDTCSTYPDPTTGKEKLKIDDFVKIKWHEVRTIGTRYGKGDCTSIKYEKVMKEKALDHVKATYTQYTEKKKGDVSMFLKPKEAAKNKFEDTFEVYKTAELKDKVDDFEYQILNTDSETYAIIYGCQIGTDGKKTERMSILSPSASFEQAQLTETEKMLALVQPSLAGKVWDLPLITDDVKCSASIFGLSTVLCAIVAMLFVLRN